ncbi:MAG: alpha/beta hydrolase [Lachnospiraceae bacterium]|nr:alpha/beta hydrolase [Lachnospiraceae bacterium]
MIIVQKIQIPGMETQKPRRLYIALPPGYEKSDTRYPVLYMFDGHNVFYDRHATFGKSWGMREYLKKSKREIIIAAVECNPEGNKRLSEYSPWDMDFSEWGLGRIKGLGKKTMDWMTKELKPLIDAQYRTLPGRENTMIAGSSMGGLMSLYAALACNKTFSRAAALSPCLFLHPERITALIRKTKPAAPTRIYLDYGGGEPAEGGMEPKALMFRTAAELTEAGATAAALVFPGAQHNEAAWEKRIPVFMDYLWAEEP